MDYFESEDQALKEIGRKFNLSLNNLQAEQEAHRMNDSMMSGITFDYSEKDLESFVACADELIKEFEISY